jgi:hypothetical protein
MFIVLIFAGAVAPAAAEESAAGQGGESVTADPASQEPGPEFRIEGIRVLWYGFVPTGLDASLTWNLPPWMEGRASKLFLKLGAGYEEMILYRYADGSPIQSTSGIQREKLLRRQPNVQVEFGPVQGLLWNAQQERNLAEAFLLYRGRFDYHYDLYSVEPFLFQSSEFTDAQGLAGNSLLAGLSYGTETLNGHRVPRGIYAESSAEWGPRWLANSLYGTSDFYRLNAQVRGFLPVFDVEPDRRLNLLSAYLCAMAAVDYSGGAEVPIYVMQSFGGRSLRDGLGGSLRGFEKRAYDTELKTVVNLEARMNGPALGHPALMPIAFLFFDAGGYAGYSNVPDGSAAAERSGLLASWGFGAAVDFFGIEKVRATVGFPLYGERLDGESWELRIDFGLHF